ncbi:MAG: NPCBM/NEW2 domain-containing protein [Verrucomicrobiota bacterium]|nr:NPCBM/NEW2 domain-containing protein [Verrucomicrobiota bacterium]
MLLWVVLVWLGKALSPASPNFWSWAERPPMGWNSWDSFGTTVTEEQTRAQAEVMARHLQPYGWEYIVVDIQWYEPHARGYGYRAGAELSMDEWGRLWPATNRFPSAAHGAGFKPLADYVHSRGLKFGLHLMRGIPREAVHRNTPVLGTTWHARDIADSNNICPWNPDMYGVDSRHPGAQAWYDSVFRLLASWGVDYVKVDDISRLNHDHEGEIACIRRAIDRCGRPMVLSLSPGETPLTAGDHVVRHANLWRISDDFWDNWAALWEQFERLHQWTPFGGPGHWPDADMLPLGVLEFGRRTTRFTQDEQITLMTLWCVARSPLMFGGDLTRLDAWTLSLLTNREVLRIHQRSMGNRQLFRNGDLIAWTARDPDSKDHYVALFHAPAPRQVRAAEALWQSPVVHRGTPGQGVSVDVPLHGARELYLVVTDAGDDIHGDHANWVEPRVIMDSGEVSLIQIGWRSAQAGWGQVAVGRDAGGGPMRVTGRDLTNGIGTHAFSVIAFDLPPGAKRFRAFAALDDEGVRLARGATVQFLLFTNEPLALPPPRTVSVNFAELGLSGLVQVRDLWTRRNLGYSTNAFQVELRAHAAGLFRLTPMGAPGNVPQTGAAQLRSGRMPPLNLRAASSIHAQSLDRGLVAFLLTNGHTYVSWRLLLSDPPGVRFWVERSSNGRTGWERMHIQPLDDRCNWVDTTAKNRVWFYRVRAIDPDGAAKVSQAVPAVRTEGSTAYLRIPLQGPYRFDKVGIADLDGDGRLDFVIKQPHQVSDPGVWRPSMDTFKLEAYRSDGTFLWGRDLGWNIEQGVWWSPMIVYDLDGDGRAEVAIKTAPTDLDYRDATGRVSQGPEWCSILDGLTGRERSRVDWPARGRVEDWGDANNNRASRHLMGVAYLDGRRPALLLLRGTYTKMVVHAYRFEQGRLVPLWQWCGDEEAPPVRGQGMHGVHTVDLDGDGCDEIVLGAAVLRPTGQILWNLGMGHPDAVYVSDVLPHRHGLEILYGFETRQTRNGICLVDGRTGRLIWGCDHPTDHVHSQGMFGDFDPNNPGPEFYTGEKFKPDRWTYSVRDGRLLSREDIGSLSPYAIWWADGWTRWVAVQGGIGPYGHTPQDRYEGHVVAVGDLVGDWREELLTCVPGELRIYVSTIPSSTRRVCWLEDRAYRTGLAHAAMGYLFPPQATGSWIPRFRP